MGRDKEGQGGPKQPVPRDPARAIGVAETELLYAAAELRSAASRGDLDNRALLYNLADGLQSAADRLLLEAEEPAEDDEGSESEQGDPCSPAPRTKTSAHQHKS